MAGPQAERERLVVLAVPGERLGGGDQVGDQAAHRPLRIRLADQPPVRLADQVVGVEPAPGGRVPPVRGERHPGQHAGVVGLPGQRGGLGQQPLDLLRRPDVVQQPGQFQQQPDPRGGLAGKLERPPVVPDRLVHGEPAGRVPGGCDQQVTGAYRVQLGAGQPRVPGQVGGAERVGERVGPVDGPDDARVPGPPRVRGEPVVERLADQVVHEDEPPAAAGQHQPGRGGSAEHAVDLGDRRGYAGRHRPPVELVAEHRGDGERLDDRGGQLVEPAAHHLPYAGRDGVREAVGVPEPGGLLDEERVSAGAPVHLGDQVGAGLATGGAGHQGGHLVPAEAGERDCGGLRAQRHQQRAQRMLAGLDLGVPVGADEQQPLEPGVPGDELEQPDRRRVGPVQVVEDHHDRPVLRDGDKRRGHRVVPVELGPAVVPRRVTVVPRLVALPGGALAEQGGQPGVDCFPGAGRVAGGPGQPAQHLDPGPVVGCGVGVPARGAEHERARVAGPRRRRPRPVWSCRCPARR